MKKRPVTPPKNDSEWARNTEKRLRALESQQSVRVGPWVLAEVDEKLVAVKPGETLEVGSEPVEPIVDDLTRGYRTDIAEAKDDAAGAKEDTQEVVDGFYQGTAGGNSTGNEPSIVKEQLLNTWTQLYDAANGTSGTAPSKLPSDITGPLNNVRNTAGDAAQDAKDISDGVSQGLDPTAGSNQSPSGIRPRFEAAWSSIHDGLNGTSGTTSAYPTTIKNSATNVRGYALEGKFNSQDIIDGVHQAVNGTVNVGNPVSSVRPNLYFSWTQIYDGLNGTSGSTNKTPSDVRDAGEGTRNVATGAKTNAQDTVDGITQGLVGGSSTNNTISVSSIRSGWFSAWGKIFDGLNGTSGTTGTVLPSNILTAGTATRAAAVNGENNSKNIAIGVSEAVKGGTQTENTPASVKSNLLRAWANFWDGLNGTSGNTSKLPTEFITVAGNVRTAALAGDSNSKAIATSISEAVKGGTQTETTPSSVKTNLVLAWSRLFDGLAGNSLGTSTNKTTSDLYTQANATRGVINKATNNTTGINTALLSGYAIEAITVSGNWYKPPNLTEIYVACFGGGAKGASAGTGLGASGGNGGLPGNIIAVELDPRLPSDGGDIPDTCICDIGTNTSLTGSVTRFRNGSTGIDIVTSNDGYKNYVSTPLGLLPTAAGGAAGGKGGSSSQNGTAGSNTTAGMLGGPGGAAGANKGGNGQAGLFFGLCQTGGAGGGGGGGTSAFSAGGEGGMGGFPSGGGGGGGVSNQGVFATPGGNGGMGLILIVYRTRATTLQT